MEEVSRDLEKAQLPYMVASVIFALINTGGLIYVSLNSGVESGRCFNYGAIFSSIFSYVLIFGIVQIIAYFKLRPIKKELNSIMNQKRTSEHSID
ncbi:hypothetical protein C5L14_16735 [Labrys okinawensis]|uniref:Uncharacterized protein n=1 Tax=Labrys okinawensis TaxID=346911 RepID=A0A2S9QC59_9HYPH|nr:hypothetical protein C5L14_16735 [Labrys okinawensis]